MKPISHWAVNAECPHCKTQFLKRSKHHRFCSRKCSEAGFALRIQLPEKQSPLRACACCLYRAGFGVKRIGKQVGKSHSNVFRWIKQAGIIDKSRDKLRYNRTAHHRAQVSSLWKLSNTNGIHRLTLETKAARALAAAAMSEQRAFRAGDESTHWGNHPALQMWAYYKNHEASKARSRESAKKIYDRRKSDPQWRMERGAKLKDYWRRNPKKKKAAGRKSYLKMKAVFPDRIRGYRKKQRLNPKWRAADNVRRRIRDMIHGRIGIRFNELVGCSRADLMTWLENQFKPGMTWGNYGTRWHVDHKTPLARFSLGDRDQRKIASHYRNLQPLWAEENIAKGDKIFAHQPELAIPLTA